MNDYQRHIMVCLEKTLNNINWEQGFNSEIINFIVNELNQIPSCEIPKLLINIPTDYKNIILERLMIRG